MELQQIRYAIELARAGHFTRAAEACHVSQPTLSHQIRKLEEELGEPLFKRLRTGTVPTPFGERFLARARRIEAEVRGVVQDARTLDDEVTGRLSVGAIPTIAPYLLPRWVRAFTTRYPNVELAISEETTESLLAHLLDGTVDLAVLSPPFDGESATEIASLPDDELLLALPRRHPLAKRPRVRLPELAGLPLILMKEEHCLTRQSLRICEQSGHRGPVAIHSSQLETVVALIESGLGVSFAPAMAVPTLGRRRVTYRPLSPERAYREIAIAWPKGITLTRAERAFVEMAREPGAR